MRPRSSSVPSKLSRWSVRSLKLPVTTALESDTCAPDAVPVIGSVQPLHEKTESARFPETLLPFWPSTMGKMATLSPASRYEGQSPEHPRITARPDHVPETLWPGSDVNGWSDAASTLPIR